MQLFNEPKLNRIARMLQGHLGFMAHAQYTHVLAAEDSIDSTKNYWHRKKEEFNWGILGLDFHSLFRKKIDSTTIELMRKGSVFSKSQFEKSQSIYQELQNKSPDYNKIIRLAKTIKFPEPELDREGNEVEVKLAYWLGGNLIMDLVLGLLGLIYFPAMAFAGLFLIPAYINGQSQYCGSPQFFLDAAKIFCCVLITVISSLIFPIAMLRSKYETDDSICFVKGSVIRKLDSIIALAEEAIEEQKNKLSVEIDNFVAI